MATNIKNLYDEKHIYFLYLNIKQTATLFTALQSVCILQDIITMFLGSVFNARVTLINYGLADLGFS